MSPGADRQDPLPLFSPTQSLSREREHVLHSIFSPTLRGGVTSYNGNWNREKREREKQEKIALAAQRIKPRPQSLTQKTDATATDQLSKSQSMRSTAHATVSLVSPRSKTSFHPKTPGVKAPCSRKPFYSPDFQSPLSTISAFSAASTCSFKSLPIDILSFDYVSTCESPEVLQQIVDTLSAERRYPSLLRSAKKQLESVRESTARRDGRPTPHLTDTQNTLYVSSTNDESSLAMSLSSSMLDGVDAEGPFERKLEAQVFINSNGRNDLEVNEENPYVAQCSRHQVRAPSGPPVEHIKDTWVLINSNSGINLEANETERSVAPDPLHEESARSGRHDEHKEETQGLINSIGGDDLEVKEVKRSVANSSHSQVSAPTDRPVIEPDESAAVPVTIEAKLLAEIQQLEDQVHSLEESKRKDSVNLLLKLKSLEEAKKNAEHKVAVLEKMVASTASNCRETMSTLANVRKDSRLLQDRLRNEQEAARSELQEAKAIEEALQSKIQSLSAQLSHFKRQSADANRSMELRLRRQVEKECSQRDGDIRSLQQALQDARSTLEAMKEERNTTIRSIQLALGKSGGGVDNLSAMERMATVGSVARKLSSSRAATKALSKALTESEIDRKKASEARDAAEKRYDESQSVLRRLERENELLTKQVQEITEELERSRAYIDKLLKRKDHSDSDWVSKEREYKQVINNLRAQVRGGEAVVSLAVYRKAVDEARARALECQDKRLEINAMTRKLTDLERRLNSDRQKVQTSRTPLDGQPSAGANLRKVTPLPSPARSTENSNPNTPKSTRMSKSKGVRPPPPPSPPVAYRISAVREAGGRAGLRAKLKHMRRSPLTNKNVSLR